MTPVGQILESKMPEKHFFTLFRMDYRTFQHVLERTQHGMQRNYLQSERGGGFVSPEDQLAFTIRWLAGGSFLDIADHYGVSVPEKTHELVCMQ
jgi:hypothetical protein